MRRHKNPQKSKQMGIQEAYKKIKEWTSSKPPIKRLPTQDQLLTTEIRFQNCVFVYKLKHIETQACKSKRRKVAKDLGYSFRSLRSSLGDGGAQDELFESCVFNPSDKTIVKEHILNFETLKLRFVNCRFLRRDNKLNERLRRYWRSYQGDFIDFSLFSQNQDQSYFRVDKQIIRLKDLPLVIEYMIEDTEIGDL